MSINKSQLPEFLRSAISGEPWGDIFPPKANPPALSVDGRTVAVKLLRQYIAALTFRRPGGVGMPPEAFKIGLGCVQIGWPDKEVDGVEPSVVILGGRAEYQPIGLTAYVQEETVDKYGKGTVVQWQSEYVETVVVEVWTEHKAEQRAILSGLEVAFTPTEQMSGLRFRMADYYDQTVCFSLGAREVVDEADNARGRRRARLELDMRFTVVALVNTVPLVPVVKADVDVDVDTGLSVEVPDDDE